MCVCVSVFAVTCAAEVPVFQLQSWLTDKFGVQPLLDLTVAVYALRMLCYASLPHWGSVWAVLPVETLHGEWRVTHTHTHT